MKEYACGILEHLCVGLDSLYVFFWLCVVPWPHPLLSGPDQSGPNYQFHVIMSALLSFDSILHIFGYVVMWEISSEILGHIWPIALLSLCPGQVGRTRKWAFFQRYATFLGQVNEWTCMWGARQHLVSVWTLCKCFDQVCSMTVPADQVPRTKVGRTINFMA